MMEMSDWDPAYWEGVSTEDLQLIVDQEEKLIGKSQEKLACTLELARRHPWLGVELLHGARMQPKQRQVEDFVKSHPTAHEGRAQDILFGGARGPGKTWFSLVHGETMACLWPRTLVLVVHNGLPELERTIVPFYGEYMSKGRDSASASYNQQKHIYKFPNKSEIHLMHLEHKTPDDLRGLQYQVVIVEEGTNIRPSILKSLFSTLRTARPGIVPHAIVTTNPGGPFHANVKARYIVERDPLTGQPSPSSPPGPFKIWTPKDADGIDGVPRVYVPGLMGDNQYLDTNYRAMVREGAPSVAHVKAWEEGDWDVLDQTIGAVWSRTDIDNSKVSWSNVPELHRILVMVDPAFSDSPDSDEVGIVLGGVGPPPLPEGRPGPYAELEVLSAFDVLDSGSAQEFQPEEIEDIFNKLTEIANGVDVGGSPPPTEMGLLDDKEVSAAVDAGVHLYVLGDFSRRGRIREWMPIVAELCEMWGADLACEMNLVGGEIKDHVPPHLLHRFVDVRARKIGRFKDTQYGSKKARAHMANTRYVQPKLVHHVNTAIDDPGDLRILEYLMTHWEFDGKKRRDPATGSSSPDRIDALSWLVIELLNLGEKTGQTVVYTTANVDQF